MRPVSLRLVPALALAATLAAPVTAFAQEEEAPYTIVYGARPITLNAETFVARGEFVFAHPAPEADIAVGLNAGFDYGIMKNLTAGVEARFGLSPDTEALDPMIYGLYRFLRGATPVELGAKLEATFPVDDTRNFVLGLGLVGSWQINKAAQLNFGVLLDLDFADPITTKLRIPLSLAISFTRNIFFDLATGVELPKVDPDGLTVPLGVQLGYTLPKSDDEPLADIYVGFKFPRFVGPSKEVGESTDLDTDNWLIQLGARIFLP